VHGADKAEIYDIGCAAKVNSESRTKCIACFDDATLYDFRERVIFRIAVRTATRHSGPMHRKRHRMKIEMVPYRNRYGVRTIISVSKNSRTIASSTSADAHQPSDFPPML
jgi:hypothetical protein